MGSSLNFNVSPTAASQYMVPAGGSGAGMIDVVNDFSWTLNKSSTLRRDVPYIELTEYQQTNGAVVANILYYYRVIGNAIPNINSLAGQNQDPTDVFKMKYIADPTGFVYKLPYFAQQRIARYNTFSDQDNQNPFGRVGESIFNNFSKGSNLSIVGDVARFTADVIGDTLPGKLGLENPKQWTDTQLEEYHFTFDLFNTGSSDDVINNIKLVELLAYQQSPFRRGVAIIDPPCIYSVVIPGVANFPAANITNFQVLDLGNKRILNNFSGLVPKTGGPPKLSIGKLVPEAFRINISVRSLFMPYRNILAEVFNGNTVQAITPTNEEQQAIDNAYAKILNAQSPGNKQVIIPGTIQQFNQSVASTA